MTMPDKIYAGKDKETGIFAYCHSGVYPCDTEYTRTESVTALLDKVERKVRDAEELQALDVPGKAASALLSEALSDIKAFREG